MFQDFKLSVDVDILAFWANLSKKIGQNFIQLSGRTGRRKGIKNNLKIGLGRCFEQMFEKIEGETKEGDVRQRQSILFLLS